MGRQVQGNRLCKRCELSSIEGLWTSKPALYAGGALLFIYYLFVTIPAQPLAIYVLLPLLMVTLVALQRNRQAEAATQDDLTAEPHLPVTVVQTLPLLLIPLLATGIYGVIEALGLALPTLQIVFAISMPLGFILFGVSVYSVWRRAA